MFLAFARKKAANDNDYRPRNRHVSEESTATPVVVLDVEGKEIIDEIMSDADDNAPTRKRRSFVLEGQSASDGNAGPGSTAPIGQKKQKRVSHKSVGKHSMLYNGDTCSLYSQTKTKHKRDQLRASESEGEISSEESSDGQTAINDVRARQPTVSVRRGPKTDTRSHWHDPVAVIEPGKAPNRWQFKCKYCQT